MPKLPTLFAYSAALVTNAVPIAVPAFTYSAIWYFTQATPSYSPTLRSFVRVSLCTLTFSIAISFRRFPSVFQRSSPILCWPLRLQSISSLVGLSSASPSQAYSSARHFRSSDVGCCSDASVVSICTYSGYDDIILKIIIKVGESPSPLFAISRCSTSVLVLTAIGVLLVATSVGFEKRWLPFRIDSEGAFTPFGWKWRIFGGGCPSVVGVICVVRRFIRRRGNLATRSWYSAWTG